MFSLSRKEVLVFLEERLVSRGLLRPLVAGPLSPGMRSGELSALIWSVDERTMKPLGRGSLSATHST